MLVRNSDITGSIPSLDSKLVSDNIVSQNDSSNAVELPNGNSGSSGSLQQSPNITADYSVGSGSATETSSDTSNIPLASTRPARA
ncbi:hypothetical protein V6N12_055509 [Hibiscus sabdariffa]|uniref:Uncharacterized protein n=1 Tax=Hibiscus sabdariffa TaxID=183260 RepID=A0ABR2BU81_9ROSI